MLIFRKWREDREEDLTATHLGKVRTLNNLSMVDTGLHNRKLNTALIRARIGHTEVNKHLHRIRLATSSLCRFCELDDETLEHLILQCPRTFSERIFLNSKLQGIGLPFRYEIIIGKDSIDRKKQVKVFRFLTIFLKKTNILDLL